LAPEWVEVVARRLGFDAVSVSLSLHSITASLRRSDTWTATMHEIGPPESMRSVSPRFEQLATTAGLGLTPREIAVELAKIESKTPPYSSAQLAPAVGVASGAFAFLNGTAPP
jgi:uncharacterized membrane protein YjjP (DUF1212 family)